MADGDHNLHQLSDREYLRLVTHIPFVERYPIKGHDKILEISTNNLFLTKFVLKEHGPKNALKMTNLSVEYPKMFEAIGDESTENQYNVVFCFLYTDFIRFDCEILLEYIYHVLIPGGKLFLTHPTNKTPTIATYRQVVESGRYPELTMESVVDYRLFDEICQSIKNIPFTSFKAEDIVDKVTLPDLDMFKRYLHDTAFVYKKVTPTEESNDIIEMQVTFFEEYCKKHYDGELVFKYVLHTLRATK